jgi:hypothetical protein
MNKYKRIKYRLLKTAFNLEPDKLILALCIAIQLSNPSYGQKIEPKYLMGTWYRNADRTTMFKYVDSTHLLQDSSSEVTFSIEYRNKQNILIVHTTDKDSSQVVYFKFNRISDTQFSIQMFRWRHINYKYRSKNNIYMDEQILPSASAIDIWTKKK